MAEGRSVLKTGVSNLSQILGYGRKLGRATQAGSPSPHPLGNDTNLSRAVALLTVEHGKSSLHCCHPVLPTSFSHAKILEHDPQNQGGRMGATVSKEHG